MRLCREPEYEFVWAIGELGTLRHLLIPSQSHAFQRACTSLCRIVFFEMHLLDLPTELFHEVLACAIRMECGLRPRLVSKIFAREIPILLRSTMVTDFLVRSSMLTRWRFPRRIYTRIEIEDLALNVQPGGAPILFRIRDVASQLCQENNDGQNLHDFIKKLCFLAHGKGLDWVPLLDCSNSGQDPLIDNDLDSDLFIAALYTGTWLIISAWLRSGRQVPECSRIFGSAARYAARIGNHEVIEALIRQAKGTFNRECMFHRLRWLFLDEAILSGRVEMARFVCGLQSKERSWMFVPVYSHYDSGWRERNEYEKPLPAQPWTIHPRNKEVFQLISDESKTLFTRRGFDAHGTAYYLRHCAAHGWVGLTAYFLTLGAPIDGVSLDNLVQHSPEQRPLLAAIKHGQEAVVRLLLDHGASASRPALQNAVQSGHLAIASLLISRGAEAGRALADAVIRGSTSIARALIERDGLPISELPLMLVRAIHSQDKAMFQLIADQGEGVAASREIWTRCMAVAKKRGYESMVSMLLLESQREISRTLPYRPLPALSGPWAVLKNKTRGKKKRSKENR